MSDLPDDFGYSLVRSLARVADPTPVRQHRPFWTDWFDRLAERRPMLAGRRPGDDPSDPTATHEFLSVGDTRIGCRLVRPESGPVRAGLVTSHGYRVAESLDADDDRWRRLTERGVAVLVVRVRGYPGSQRDTGDLTKPDHAGGGWITRGLAASTPGLDGDRAWILPHAVADVANACRALRNAMLDRTESPLLGVKLSATAPEGASRPLLFLHGESFGAGLAVIASAMLSGKVPHDPLIDRLAVGLPTFADWPWRLAHGARTGTTREVGELITRHRKLEEAIRDRLRLCDTVVHAGRIRSPALVKIAQRDDVVPAPTQAAMYNALACDPGRRWRFLVPTGHHDSGITGARRHALFQRCLDDFLDPARAPEEAMTPWEPLLTTGQRAPDGDAPSIAPPADDADSDPDAPASLFPGSPPPDQRDRALIAAYARAGRTLDALPYTPQFDAVFAEVSAVSGGAFRSKRDAFHRLHNLRKAGKLPRLGKAKDHPPSIEPDEESVLEGLVVEAVGSLGQRDRLPFTSDFDALAERFTERTGRRLSPHDLWRLIAKLAK
ncbi:MAG: acetylxylan esterase [Phycisphaerales bacterium JB040]